MVERSLPEELLIQRDRVRDEVVPAYEGVGFAGEFALQVTIRPALERADRALTSGDVVEQVKSLKELREIKL